MNIFTVIIFVFAAVGAHCEENNKNFKTENVLPNSQL
jgi:hypothetical protein